VKVINTDRRTRRHEMIAMDPALLKELPEWILQEALFDSCQQIPDPPRLGRRIARDGSTLWSQQALRLLNSPGEMVSLAQMFPTHAPVIFKECAFARSTRQAYDVTDEEWKTQLLKTQPDFLITNKSGSLCVLVEVKRPALASSYWARAIKERVYWLALDARRSASRGFVYIVSVASGELCLAAMREQRIGASILKGVMFWEDLLPMIGPALVRAAQCCADRQENGRLLWPRLWEWWQSLHPN